MRTLSHRETRQLLFLATLAVFIQSIPLYRFGVFFFGHDYGFYRRFLIQPVVSFPNTPVPGLDHTVFLPRMVLDCARFLIPSPDVALITAYVIFLLLGLFCVWRLATLYLPGTVAVYAALLYVVSSVQFESYSQFFFKEAVALPLFILTLFCFEKKRYLWGAVLGILVVLTHQTSVVILLGVLGLAFLYRIRIDRAFPFFHMFGGAAIAAAYFFLHPHVAQKIASPPVGIFISKQVYIIWSLPLIVFIAIGARRFWPVLKKHPILAAALSITAAFFLFDLPFANRVYVFLDLFLTIPAAMGLIVLKERITHHTRIVQIMTGMLIIVMCMIPLVYNESMHAASLDTESIQAVHGLSAVPSSASIITTPALLPWVQGWTTAAVYAPGNLKEPHALSEWSQYWTHGSRSYEQHFLASFPEPLYIFVSPHDMQYRPHCSTEVSPYLFKPTC